MFVTGSGIETTVVVRGGQNRDAGQILKALQATESAIGKAVLSVHVDTVGEQETRGETLYRICEGAPVVHSKVQVSSVERLSAAGFKIEHEVGPNESRFHHHVYFEVPVTESRIQQFLDCLDEPVANPTGGMRRKR